MKIEEELGNKKQPTSAETTRKAFRPSESRGSSSSAFLRSNGGLFDAVGVSRGGSPRADWPGRERGAGFSSTCLGPHVRTLRKPQYHKALCCGWSTGTPETTPQTNESVAIGNARARHPYYPRDRK